MRGRGVADIEAAVIDKILAALIAVESGGNSAAWNEDEGAIGALQIRRIMVHEVNILVGYRKYSHVDAWDEGLSREMAREYFKGRVTEKRLKRKPRLEDYPLAWRWGAAWFKKERNAAMDAYVAKFMTAWREIDGQEKESAQAPKAGAGKASDAGSVVAGGTGEGWK
jgi:hypothetical protein